jgi:hypothetical protein
LRNSDEGFDFPPNLDGLNMPYMDDETRGSRDKKRPDLQWCLKNSNTQRKEEYIRYFAMECKRLGIPSSTTWILNSQYVSSGICRFIKARYGYGSPKHNPSYAMIGYVQNMELGDILNEVNEEAKAHSISTVELSSDGWKEKDISRLAHQLDRPEIHHTPLTLHHLWIDVRDISIVPAKKGDVAKRRAKAARKVVKKRHP